MVRIGYAGDIYKAIPDLTKRMDYLNKVSIDNKLDYLILCGGIGRNFHEAAEVVKRANAMFADTGVSFRYVFGNSDLYCTETANRKRNVEYAIHKLKSMQGCLIQSPIIRNEVKIYGAETWYDYSLYRGDGVSSEKLMKKRIFGYRNLDSTYITEERDYLLGLENTFDIQYSKKCRIALSSLIESHLSKYGRTSNTIVVGYFKPWKYFIGESVRAGYAGAFEGGSYIGELIAGNQLARYVFGHTSPENSCAIRTTEFVCSSVLTSRGLYVEDYGVNQD